MINRLTIPVITDKAIDKLLKFLRTEPLNKNMNMFEVGYRACKEDILSNLIRDCKIDTPQGVEQLLTEIRRRTND